MKKKNLIVAICGDESMHKIWMDKQKDFDLFVVYYGDDDEKYKKDFELVITNAKEGLEVTKDEIVEISNKAKNSVEDGLSKAKAEIGEFITILEGKIVTFKYIIMGLVATIVLLILIKIYSLFRK